MNNNKINKFIPFFDIIFAAIIHQINFKTMEVKQSKRKLPRGSVNEISRKTGLSTATVSNVLRGKARSAKAAEVFEAAAEYLTEYKAKEAAAMQALNEALSESPAKYISNQ